MVVRGEEELFLLLSSIDVCKETELMKKKRDARGNYLSRVAACCGVPVSVPSS